MTKRKFDGKIISFIIVISIINTFISWALFFNVMSYYFNDIKTIQSEESPKDEYLNGNNMNNKPKDSLLVEYEPIRIDEGFSFTELHKLGEIRNPFSTAPIVNDIYEKDQAEYEDYLDSLQKELEKIKEQEEAEKNKDKNTNNPPNNGDHHNQNGNNNNPDDNHNYPPNNNQGNNNQHPDGTDKNNPKTEIPLYSNKGLYLGTKEVAPSKDTVTYTREEVEMVANSITTDDNRNVPSKWLVALAQHTSNYQANLKTTDSDGVIRKGITQYREDAAKFVKEELNGGAYNPELDTNLTYNMDIATRYLYYLYNVNADLHYTFTTYLVGEHLAESIKNQQGNYETDFSKAIIKLLEER